ncbi:uncharacterized protein JCM6883_002195 [Sporobolomyces salmoneus]|uniref:uncharacterized protein n=1 Tax=Sporobolomyces salmoneus TaxID=183962 RepID=UPI0031828DF6
MSGHPRPVDPLGRSTTRPNYGNSTSTSPHPSTSYEQYQDYSYIRPPLAQPGGSPRGGDKRRRESIADEDEEGESPAGTAAGSEDSKPKKKPKGRAVLSCGECKRRKVKCDRKIPCATCIARGQADRCAWDDPLARPEGQPFALATQYDEVIARLDRIEHFLDTLPSDIRNQAKAISSNPSSSSKIPEEPPTPKPKFSTEMEDAATKLESTAFQQQRIAAPSPVGLQFLASAIDMVPPIRPSNSPDRHAEATTALTSIVNQPIRFEGPTKAVSSGFDLCFTEDQLLQQRDQSLEKIYALLPTPEVTQQIIQAYFEDVSWFYSILHPPAFLAEVERFEEMLRAGRQNEIDLAWLGIFFAVLALGLDGAQTVAISPLSFNSKPEATATWYAASLRLFHMSNWPNHPQFRLVQLVALFGQYNLTSGGGTDMGGFLSYLAIGVRISQKLRLHQLGTDPKTMPPDDLAFPKGASSVKRQTAIRVFAIISFLDVVTATNRMGAYLIHPSQVTTPIFDNLNFDQLSTTEWKTEPAPRHVWTDSSLELNKTGGGKYMRLVFDRLVTNAKDFTYETVLELDREMRVHLSTFPESMTVENVQQEEKNPKLRKQRFMSMSGAYSRLVRLHRPFLVTGFTNSRYKFSKDACLQAARKVITAHYNGRDVLKNLRIVHSHTLSAAIVIYSYIFHLIDTNAPISEITREKETASAAYEVFSTTQVTAPKLNKVIQHAVAICSLLSTAVEERQAQKSHRTQNAGLESFAMVLRRIAKQLSLAQSSPSDSDWAISDHRPMSVSATSSSSSRTTAFGSTSTTTPASSTYQQSPSVVPSRKPSTVDQFLPAPQSQTGGIENVSPTDSAFAAMFLGDLGLSSSTRPGPDVYDLSWLDQSNSTSLPSISSPMFNGSQHRFDSPSQMYHSLPPIRQSSPSVFLPSASSHSQSFLATSPQAPLYSPHLGSSLHLAVPNRGSLSPQQPLKAWFLDGTEGADALYSQIK